MLETEYTFFEIKLQKYEQKLLIASFIGITCKLQKCSNADEYYSMKKVPEILN